LEVSSLRKVQILSYEISFGSFEGQAVGVEGIIVIEDVVRILKLLELG
jgi:hypothetical protein